MNTNYVHLQWNCKGIKGRHEELQHLISLYKPKTISLQETKLNSTEYLLNTGYKLYNRINPGNTIQGGVAIVIDKTINHQKLYLQTNLQAIAIKLLEKPYLTICNIYLPPNEPLPCREITELIDQLTPPYLLVGDFNAHNPLWGEHRNNTRGNKLAEIILNKNLVVLNKKAPTYHRLYDNTSSIIDLTLTTPTQAPNYNWTRLEDLHGSDHYPIVIRETTNNRTLNKKNGRWTKPTGRSTKKN